jgi:outer membrane protein W
VGPAIFIASMRPKIRSQDEDKVLYGIAPGSSTDVSVGLATELGVRYMCLKNVSVSLSFRYRYAQPTFSYNNISRGIANEVNSSFSISPSLHLFSSQLGVAYHF